MMSRNDLQELISQAELDNTDYEWYQYIVNLMVRYGLVPPATEMDSNAT